MADAALTHYRFPCGCTWPVAEANPPPGVVPLLDFDVEDAPENCPATWALLGRGEAKGVFQLESSLGRTWTKKLKPESLEHMAALGALLRPGCLRAVDEEGVSMTQHYVRRKNKLEEVELFHPAIDPILFPTYGVLVYQEQAMAIAQAVAGFTEQEADVLRKAIGKKLPEEMAKCKTMFLEGAEKAGIISAGEAEQVFGWIEASQRYSFNKSHSACYGVTGYHSAYIKAHCPVAFFAAWLKNARHKQDPQQEVFELVQDARLFDVEVEPPDLLTLQPFFHTDRKVVKFGLSNIKGVGEAQIVKLKAAVEEAVAGAGKPLREWTWWEFLVRCAPRLTSSVVVRLIQVGALRWTGMLRAQMEAEHKAWTDLTRAEQAWVAERFGQFDNLVDALKALGRPKHRKVKPTKRRVPKKGKEEAAAELQKLLDEISADLGRHDLVYEGMPGPETEEEAVAHAEQGEAIQAEYKKVEAELAKVTKWVSDPPPPPPEGPEGGCSSPARESVVQSLAQLLEHPPSPRVDTPIEMAANEEELLGISITCGKIDACDVSAVNCTCKDFLGGRDGFLVLGVEVQQVREVKTRNGKQPGQKMAFCTVSDNTCAISDVVVFPSVFKEYGHLFREGNTVIIQGERDRKDEDSAALHVKKAWQANPGILAA